jgi:hypothetical protein
VKATEGDYVSSYDGTRIHYLDEGEGICLFPCNGVLGSTGYWAYFRHFFRNRCRVVVWDYRGHGRSELPTNVSCMSIGSYCHDLKSVLDRLGGSEGRPAGPQRGCPGDLGVLSKGSGKGYGADSYLWKIFLFRFEPEGARVLRRGGFVSMGCHERLRGCSYSPDEPFGGEMYGRK